MKDFLRWIGVKQAAHETTSGIVFDERDIWWCKLGANVGYEVDGRGGSFERPVIIVKKFNLDTCLVIPLTTKPKKGKYYFSIGSASGREAVANLSQLRLVDRRRLTQKTGVIAKPMFKALLAELVRVNFTYEDTV